MPGIHRYHTIAFRPTTWERELIEKRWELSGLMKKDFIIQSCIHSRIEVAVTKKHMQRIIGEVQEMRDVMKDIAEQMMFGNIALSDKYFQEMKEEYLALAVSIVNILNGASYLFGYGSSEGSPKWKARKDVEELAEAVRQQEKMIKSADSH